MYKVLVVEDSQSEMARVRSMLKTHNFDIVEATNGQMGVEMAVKHQPDVILMDIVMPEMNGFQATRQVARGKDTSHIPVIMCSTKNQETDKVWGKRQGARAYLTKPFLEEDLLKTIHSVIG